MPEALDAKVARLLAGHRVFVKSVAPEQVHAVVRGDSGLWDVDLHHGRWSCPCPARTTCSHLRAVWAVTVPPRGNQIPHPSIDQQEPHRA